MLEHEKKGLQESLNTLQIEEEACSKLQHRIQQLESQISDIQLLLDKEKAKYQSACRQQEVSITASTWLFVVFHWALWQTRLCVSHTAVIK